MTAKAVTNKIHFVKLGVFFSKLPKWMTCAEEMLLRNKFRIKKGVT